MPVLTFRIAPRLIQPHVPGSAITLQNPQQVLIESGPRANVTVSLSSVLSDQYAQSGLTVPNTISGLGLIDTGAGCTCIDESAMRASGFNPIDQSFMTSATHEAEPCGVYAIRLNINSIDVDVNRAYGANLAPQGLLALIGRDVLSRGIFVYNGSSAEFVLSL